GRAMRPAYARVEPVDEVSMPVFAGDHLEPEPDLEVIEPAQAIEDQPSASPRLPPLAELAGEPLRRTIGEVDVERAAEGLIAGGVMRAVFVSPEGDDGAAASVLVAREIADAGLR